MNKILTVFKLAWEDQFVYRLNFVLWRIRNVARLMMTYFLWSGVFLAQGVVFGYEKTEMLTYVFAVLIINSIVLSAPSADNIGGEIASGDLNNYLLKPLNYLTYWFTRDVASKLLNLLFAAVEISLLWWWLQPKLSWPNSGTQILFFVIMCLVATMLYFFVNVLTKLVAFWYPENTWGITFLMLVMIEVLAGGIFPLDILPTWFANLLELTPFPYLIYFPVAVWLGKIEGFNLLLVSVKALIWVAILYWGMMKVWKRGLKSYAAYGR